MYEVKLCVILCANKLLMDSCELGSVAACMNHCVSTCLGLNAAEASIIMNALECRTLAATCMHDSCACIAWLTVYACSISGILNYIPCT